MPIDGYPVMIQRGEHPDRSFRASSHGPWQWGNRVIKQVRPHPLNISIERRFPQLIVRHERLDQLALPATLAQLSNLLSCQRWPPAKGDTPRGHWQCHADLGTHAAHQQHAAAQWEQTAAQWQHTLAQRDDLLARQERDLAQLRELAAQPLRAGDLDLMKLAQALREPRAIPWREIEELIGVAQSTLRARLKSAPLAPALEVAA